MIDKVYKVVRKDGRKWVSVTGCLPEEFRATYSLNKITYPVIKNSYLYAFVSIKDARDFLHANPHFGITTAIFKCEADTINQTPFMLGVWNYARSSFLDFWNYARSSFLDFWKGELPFSKREPPPGTVWCAWIKPIKLQEED